MLINFCSCTKDAMGWEAEVGGGMQFLSMSELSLPAGLFSVCIVFILRSVCLCLYCVCPPLCLSVSVLYLITGLPGCQCVRSLVYLSVSVLHARQSVQMPICALSCLPVCLPVWFFFFLPVSFPDRSSVRLFVYMSSKLYVYTHVSPTFYL